MRWQYLFVLPAFKLHVTARTAALFARSQYMDQREVSIAKFLPFYGPKPILDCLPQFPYSPENALLIASDYLASYRDLHVTASYDTRGLKARGVVHVLPQAGSRNAAVSCCKSWAAGVGKPMVARCSWSGLRTILSNSTQEKRRMTRRTVRMRYYRGVIGGNNLRRR